MYGHLTTGVHTSTTDSKLTSYPLSKKRIPPSIVLKLTQNIQNMKLAYQLMTTLNPDREVASSRATVSSAVASVRTPGV